jgi:predicted RNA binding protein YcfA (HicA-like mRNA interferase family)
MLRLRRLSSRQVLGIFHSFGFTIVSIRGSQANLKREFEGQPPQILTLPLHRDLAPGTLRAIYRQALRFIPEFDLRPHFYGDGSDSWP